MKKVFGIVGAVAIAIALTGCGSSSGAASGDNAPQAGSPTYNPSVDAIHTDTPSPAPTPNILARNACDDFRLMAGDASNGLLNNAELRDALKNIYDNARYSDSQDIASAAKLMLSADTVGDTDSLKVGIASMDTFCTALGH